MTTCNGPAPPQGLSPDPATAAQQIRNAIFMLSSGATVQEIRERESWMRFMSGGAPSLPALRRLLYEIETAADPSYQNGRTIRMGPARNAYADTLNGRNVYR